MLGVCVPYFFVSAILVAMPEFSWQRTSDTNESHAAKTFGQLQQGGLMVKVTAARNNGFFYIFNSMYSSRMSLRVGQLLLNFSLNVITSINDMLRT
jgi:hypothetical protein